MLLNGNSVTMDCSLLVASFDILPLQSGFSVLGGAEECGGRETLQRMEEEPRLETKRPLLWLGPNSDEQSCCLGTCDLGRDSYEIGETSLLWLDSIQ